MTKVITDLIDVHSPNPVAVLGGGPSLPSDIEQLPPDCITVAANHHAFLAGHTPDYVVYKDELRKLPVLREYLETYKGVVISKREEYTDYKINVATFDRGFTGTLACWIACMITNGPVILCGIDCYSSDRPYFHNQVLSFKGSFERYTSQWELAWGKVAHIPGCRFPERISAMSGPLTEIFKKYECN